MKRNSLLVSTLTSSFALLLATGCAQLMSAPGLTSQLPSLTNPSSLVSPGSSAASPAAASPMPAPMAQAEPEKKVEKIQTVSVQIKNECSKSVDFCIASGSSTKHTSLGGNGVTNYTLSPGDKVQAKEGSSCSKTLLEVPESKDGQRVVVCK